MWSLCSDRRPIPDFPPNNCLCKCILEQILRLGWRSNSCWNPQQQKGLPGFYPHWVWSLRNTGFGIWLCLWPLFGMDLVIIWTRRKKSDVLYKCEVFNNWEEFDFSSLSITIKGGRTLIVSTLAFLLSLTQKNHQNVPSTSGTRTTLLLFLGGAYLCMRYSQRGNRLVTPLTSHPVFVWHRIATRVFKGIIRNKIPLRFYWPRIPW